MKFYAGSIVRTCTGDVGKVVEKSLLNVPMPYDVEFVNGEVFHYDENELELASAGEAIQYHYLEERSAEERRTVYDGSNKAMRSDPVEHPSHYTNHPSGIECIQITEHMSFTLGNAVKYIWRADLKNDAVEDLKKARFYINREIEKRERA